MGVVDISTEKRLEAQLAHSHKLQAVGQLAGGIAHDFNNLLTAMIGAADEVLQRPELAAEVMDDVRQIRASADRGAALVRQLLAFGRQQTLQPRVIAINDAITDISALLRRLLGSNVRLELELEEPGRMVRVDPTQLDQVLVNLAVNARDAMPNGGTLTLHSGHITLFRPLTRGQETIPPGRYVMIEVGDTGVGIPPDVLSRVFDPFFTTRRERGGSGLGLSTVHGIVRQSDGFLAVESEVGQGTRMRVYLPRHEAADGVPSPSRATPPPVVVAPAPVAPVLVQPGPAALRTLLLVDDEMPVLRLAERALSRRGWRGDQRGFGGSGSGNAGRGDGGGADGAGVGRGDARHGWAGAGAPDPPHAAGSAGDPGLRLRPTRRCARNSPARICASCPSRTRCKRCWIWWRR